MEVELMTLAQPYNLTAALAIQNFLREYVPTLLSLTIDSIAKHLAEGVCEITIESLADTILS
jgi:hypothetical protein